MKCWGGKYIKIRLTGLSRCDLWVLTCPRAEVEKPSQVSWTTINNDNRQRRPAMAKTTMTTIMSMKGKRRQKLQQPWHPTTNNNNHHDTQQQPGHPTTTMTPNNIEQTTTMMATASDQLTFCRTDWHLVRIWKIKSLLEWHSRVVHCSFADTVDCQILLLWHYSSVTSALVPAFCHNRHPVTSQRIIFYASPFLLIL